MTQPIHPDRATPAIADRDRALPGRAEAAKTAAGADHSPSPAHAAAPGDTADVAHADALLRATAAGRRGGRPLDGAQAAALTARVAALMRSGTPLALQAHAGIHPEGVQALLATV